MYGMAENFGGTTTKEGLALRFAALNDYSIEEIQAGATWLIKNRTENFPAMPTVKEMIEAMKNCTGLNLNPESMAEIQADLVLNKLRIEGRAGRIDFQHPVTQHLMTTRWKYRDWAATVMEADLKWWRQEFLKAFKAYSEANEARASLGYSGDTKLLDLAGGVTKQIGAGR